jgi:predicted metal-dependent phosphoesterase TrpH
MTATSAQVVSSGPAAQDVLALQQVFQTLNASSCPYQFNFHMHTCASDGKLQPEALAQQAIAIGLKGFAITDHHSVNGYRVVQNYLDCHTSLLDQDATLPQLWTGVEVTAHVLDTEVHVLGYAFDPEHPALEPYLQGGGPVGDSAVAENVITAIHTAGGLAVLAHPARYRRSPQELIPALLLSGIDGVEAYYAYNNPSTWRPSPQQTSIVEDLAQTYGLLSTCGTDTHGINLLQRL